MVESCVEDYSGGGYHFGGAIITGQPEIVSGPFINGGDYSLIGGGGSRRRQKKSRKLRKSNKTRMISRSKKSRSRSISFFNNILLVK